MKVKLTPKQVEERRLAWEIEKTAMNLIETEYLRIFGKRVKVTSMQLTLVS